LRRIRKDKLEMQMMRLRRMYKLVLLFVSATTAPICWRRSFQDVVKVY
jgi:ribosomal protein L30/L7E